MLTNKHRKTVRDHFEKIKADTHKIGAARILYHQSGNHIPREYNGFDLHVFKSDILHSLGYTPIFDRRLIPGSNHFAILDFYRDNPNYKYYWLIEDDVRFSGSWSTLFDTFADFTHDFISSNIRKFEEEPLWIYWNSLVHRGQSVPNINNLRSFNPIYRISNRALKLIDHMLLNQWQGHHEVLIPTLLNQEGFSVLDFGGNGGFCLPEFENKFYTTNSLNIYGELYGGTMRCRPPVRYLIEQNMIYHPVKSL